MKTGGATPLYNAFYDEIIERTAKGYRVIFTLVNGTSADLKREVEEMARRGALPWGVGLWNELDFGGRNTPQEFEDLITDDGLVEALIDLNERFDVKISPPGIANFSNLILEGYGESIKKLFKDVPSGELFIKVHQYGHVEPKLWVELNLKEEALLVTGLPSDGVIILEETANSFVGEREGPREGVFDQEGADFMRAAMYAGMQSKIPTCHFMLYHKFSDYNNISHPVYGELKRTEALATLDYVRLTNDINPPGSTDLENSTGRKN